MTACCSQASVATTTLGAGGAIRQGALPKAVRLAGVGFKTTLRSAAMCLNLTQIASDGASPVSEATAWRCLGYWAGLAAVPG